MVVAAIAAAAGASEAALRLILGQLLGYPLMILYRQKVATQETTLQHLYFFLTGLLAGWWVIGGDVKHSLYAIMTTYLILVAAGGTFTSVVVSFVFNFGYLLVGYYFTESEGYDICWTMPHCVLVLRLIGLTFDCYDGEKARRAGGMESLSKDQQKSAIEELPSLLEMLSHSFFIGGYFVGPQFPMKKYREFVSPSYQDSLPGSPHSYGFKRLGLGLCYMVVHVVGSLYLPADWPASDSFYNSWLVTKLLLLPIWCRFILAKYLFAWLSAEGVCIISGLAFNGVKEGGFIDWKGCANVKVARLEGSRKFGHVIESFNINTNNWVAVYVYKRLKFMGSRTISQVVTLLFLAVWHGFHSGYYLTFLNEFLTVKVEREFLAIWSRSSKVEKWLQDPQVAFACKILGWCWVFFILPHCFISFALLTYNKFIPAYFGTYFFVYILFFTWPLWKGAVKDLLGGPLKEKDEVKSKDSNADELEEKVQSKVDETGNIDSQEISSPAGDIPQEVDLIKDLDKEVIEAYQNVDKTHNVVENENKKDV